MGSVFGPKGMVGGAILGGLYGAHKERVDEAINNMVEEVENRAEEFNNKQNEKTQGTACGGEKSMKLFWIMGGILLFLINPSGPKLRLSPEPTWFWSFPWNTPSPLPKVLLQRVCGSSATSAPIFASVRKPPMQMH